MVRCSKCHGVMLSNYGEFKCINCGYERIPKMRFSPMLAKLTKEPFDSEDHIFERKYDGIRCIAYVDSERTTLINRSQVDITKRFPEIGLETSALCTLDGELECSSFQAMQTRANRLTEIDAAVLANPAKFKVFDILERDNIILTGMPLIERKAILEETLKPNDYVEITPFVCEYGIDEFNKAEENGWEGIIAKKINSQYYPGRRTDAWLKVKVQKFAECSIIGATIGLGKRSGTFGALVVAHGNRIVGEVGTGYTDEELEQLDSLLKIVSQQVVRQGWKYEMGLDILKCRVKFSEWTDDGNLRFPVYEGLV
jgi:bifunctional non-homologous end joining protein LigD